MHMGPMILTTLILTMILMTSDENTDFYGLAYILVIRTDTCCGLDLWPYDCYLLCTNIQ